VGGSAAGGISLEALTYKEEREKMSEEWTVETGWVLIRDGATGGLEYIGVDSGFLNWTPDNLKALRLARREDADALAEIVDDCERIEEHQWTGPKSSKPTVYLDPPNVVKGPLPDVLPDLRERAEEKKS